MNYAKIYNNLIGRAKNRVLSGYVERHHIIPRCMGGGDDISNLVALTAEEHFIAHQLLVKMYPSNYKLVYACNFMRAGSKNMPDRINNKMYGWIKKKLSAIRKQNSGVKAPNYGKTHSIEAREKMRQARIGKKLSPESIAKREATRKERYGEDRGYSKMGQLSAATTKGKTRDPSVKAKISKTLMGHAVSAESRAKMSASAKNRKKK